MLLSLPARLPPAALLRPGVLLLVAGLHAAALAWLLAGSAPEPVVAPSAPVIEGVLLAPPADEPTPSVPAPLPTPTRAPVPTPAPVLSRPAPAPLPAPSAAAPESLPAPPPLQVAAAAAPATEASAAGMPTAGPPAADATENLPVVPPMERATARDQPRSYPALSVSRQEEGRVVLEVYIRADGTVGEVRLLQSSGYRRLDTDAMQSVRRWRYVPARRGNQPIPYWYRQPVDYQLQR
jgi:protein TonB